MCEFAVFTKFGVKSQVVKLECYCIEINLIILLIGILQ